MDPFRIICPACSTKLVVRQPELVGRTVPCPKCKNAIHVVRPGEVAWNPGSVQSPPRKPASTVNSEAITKADPGDWDIDALESALAQQNASSGQTEDGGFFRDANGDPAASRKKQSEPFEIQPLDPNINTPASTAAPPSAWQSPQAKARRQLLTVVIVGIAGCLLAALTFLGFLNTYGKKNRDKQPEVANAPVNPKDDLANQLAVQPQLAPEAAPKIEAAQPVDPADPMEPVAQEAPGLKAIPPDAQPQNNNPNAGTIEPNPENPTPMNLDSPNIGLKENPNALINPNEIQSNPNPKASSDNAPAENGPPAEDNLPSIFQDFLPVFDRSSQPGWSDLGKEGDKTIDQELALENADVVFSQEYYPQPIQLPAWAERAQRTTGRLKTPQMSVPRFVHWLNRLSGHAISLDWFLFNLSDIPLDQPVSIQSEGTSIGEILDGLKNTIGADVEINQKGFVFLRPKPEKLSTKLKPDGSTSLGPMAKGLPDGQDQAILKLVLELLQIDGCQYQDGKIAWSPDANAYQQAQVLASLASIREAIADAPKGEAVSTSSDSTYDFNRPSAWLKLYRQSRSKLGADEIMYEERPIIDIITRAAQATKTEVLIDWPAVWSHGLHPNRMALSLLRGRNLLEISNRYLEDHSLELVPLDSKTWMLTTDDQRRSMVRLVAVRIDKGLGLEETRVSLRGLVPRGVDGKSMFTSAAVPGAQGVVLLRICPPNSSLLADNELVKALGLDNE